MFIVQTRVWFLFLFIGIGLSTNIAADSLPYFLWPTTNITATKKVNPLKFDTHSVYILEKSTLKQSGVHTLSGSLAQFSNLNVASAGGVSGLFLRGLASNQYQLLYDGVSLYNPSTPQGTPSFEAFLSDQIDRVEIVEGSLSDVYGSSSMGGVIQFLPNLKKSALDWNFSNTHHSLSTVINREIWDTKLHLSYANKNVFGLSTIRNTTELDNQFYENFRIRLQKTLPFGDLILSYMNAHSKLGLDQTFAPDKTSAVLDDPNKFIETNQDISFLSLKTALSPSITQSLSYQISNVYSFAQNATDNMHPTSQDTNKTNGRMDRVALGYDWIPSALWSSHIGADYHREEMETLYQAPGYSNPFDLSNQTRFGFNTFHRLHLAPVVVYGGFRKEFYEAYPNRKSLKDTNAYSLGAIYTDPWLDIDFKGNISQGFRVPSLYERRYFVGSPKIETSYLKDLTIEKKWGSYGAAITVFQSSIFDKIEYRELSDDPYFSYINLGGESLSTGTTYRVFGENMGVLDYLSLSYTNQLANRSNGTPYPRAANRKLTLLSGTHIGPLKIGGSAVYVSERSDDVYLGFDSTPTQFNLRAYVLANISFKLPLSEALNSYATISNLLNDRYEEALGYPGLERSVTLGLEYNF